MIGLAENKDLYDKLSNVIKDAYFDIHAIYEPELNKPDILTNPFGDCYCAAVDLFSWRFTFRIYFKILEDGSLDIKDIERWHFG